MPVAAQSLRGILAVAMLWQGAVWLLSPPRFILPPPLDVARVFVERRGYLAEHFFITLWEVLAGLGIGALAGALTALFIAALPRAGSLLWTVVLVLQALPVFALAPLLVLWFGFGMASKVAMAGLIIFFPVASAFADGLRRTDRGVLDAVALTDATHWQVLWMIRVPLALPSLISGLRVAAALAPLGAVIGEWVGASGGLGFIMIQANARMQADILFAALALLAVLTLALRYAVDELTSRLVPWAPETR